MSQIPAPTEANEPLLTHGELLADAKLRFGPDPLDIAFRCPNCGDVATIREFAEDRRGPAGQECIGRSLGALDAPSGTWKGRGCDYAAYGLIKLGVPIAMPDGNTLWVFPLADAPERSTAADQVTSGDAEATADTAPATAEEA